MDKELPPIFRIADESPQLGSCRLSSRPAIIMNFAPYQDESPEIERALSPPTVDGRVRSPGLRSPRASTDLPSPSHFVGGGHGNTGYGRDLEGGHVSLGAFETSLPIRMDVEAALAYLLLPPAGGLILLLAEHKSDYVRYVFGVKYAGLVEEIKVANFSHRFHAWQSSMLFAVIFVSYWFYPGRPTSN